MASNLTERLSRLVKTMRGQARITESNVQDMLREVRMALLEADVNFKVVKQFIDAVAEKAVGQEVMTALSPAQQVVKIVHDALVAALGEQSQGLSLGAPPAPGRRGCFRTARSA